MSTLLPCAVIVGLMPGYFINFHLPHRSHMATPDSFPVYFTCRSCEAIYVAIQQRTPSAAGHYTCKNCKKTVHKWLESPYGFTNWRGPLYKTRVTEH